MSVKSNMRDVSFDLETLDTRFSAAILSIGMVLFDRETGEIGRKEYVEISFDSAIKCGSVSGSTLAWWMQQSEKARAVFTKTEGRQSIPVALDRIASVIRSEMVGARVWGNGASFDITILEHAFLMGTHGLAIPWHFVDIRDMRTTIDDAGIDLSKLPRIGTHHNAVDDAESQAVAISVARRTIRAALGHKLPPWRGPKVPHFEVCQPAKGGLEKLKDSAPAPTPITPTDDDDEL